MAMDSVLAGLREEVRTARAAKRSLTIRGGGSRMFYGEPLAPEPAPSWLDLSGFRGIVDYAPAELVLTARAGTLLSEIEERLASGNQMLAFEPPRFGAADTIGGCVATGLSGPRRMATGRVADFVLGARLLTSSGEVLHFGGEVMKNVAGYDLSRLLAGSLGILGALLEVSLKVVPRPRCEVTRSLELDEAAALAQCLAWRSRPIPISATAWSAGAEGGGGHLTVRLSGNRSAVGLGAEVVGGEALDADVADRFWLGLRDQTDGFFLQRPLWRVVVPPRCPPLARGPTLHEWGGTLRWLAGPQDAAALRAQVQKLGGSACLYRREGAGADVATFHPLPAGVAGVHERLKHEFDPDGIFNRGRLVRGL